MEEWKRPTRSRRRRQAHLHGCPDITEPMSSCRSRPPFPTYAPVVTGCTVRTRTLTSRQVPVSIPPPVVVTRSSREKRRSGSGPVPWSSPTTGNRTVVPMWDVHFRRDHRDIHPWWSSSRVFTGSEVDVRNHGPEVGSGSGTRGLEWRGGSHWSGSRSLFPSGNAMDTSVFLSLSNGNYRVNDNKYNYFPDNYITFSLGPFSRSHPS